jgi:hypothetical protein
VCSGPVTATDQYSCICIYVCLSFTYSWCDSLGDTRHAVQPSSRGQTAV